MSLLTRENITKTPIEDGDAGIIFKPDGTFRIFNTFEGGNLTKPTEAQIEIGKKMMALVAALQIPQIMSLLMDCASDPAIVGTNLLDLGKLDG